jgi:hypothetical protein
MLAKIYRFDLVTYAAVAAKILIGLPPVMTPKDIENIVVNSPIMPRRFFNPSIEHRTTMEMIGSGDATTVTANLNPFISFASE